MLNKFYFFFDHNAFEGFSGPCSDMGLVDKSKQTDDSKERTPLKPLEKSKLSLMLYCSIDVRIIIKFTAVSFIVLIDTQIPLDVFFFLIVPPPLRMILQNSVQILKLNLQKNSLYVPNAITWFVHSFFEYNNCYLLRCKNLKKSGCVHSMTTIKCIQIQNSNLQESPVIMFYHNQNFQG